MVLLSVLLLIRLKVKIPNHHHIASVINDCGENISALFLYYALGGTHRLSSSHRKPYLGTVPLLAYVQTLGWQCSLGDTITGCGFAFALAQVRFEGGQ